MEKSVIVTGCSSGIGLRTAQMLKERGFRVLATARKSMDVEHLVKEGFESLQLDLASNESIHAAMSQILALTQGHIWGLVNNAAFGLPGAVEDLTSDVLREQFETNFFGTHELTRLVLQAMRKHNTGRIVQISSVLGFVAVPYRGAYVASKFALEGLTDSLRMELKGSGIYVSLVEPGPISSRFRQNAYQLFKDRIDIEKSSQRQRYNELEEHFRHFGGGSFFTLPPDAVAAKIITALESPKPKARYYVTAATYILSFLKRVLPTSVLDFILMKGKA